MHFLLSILIGLSGAASAEAGRWKCFGIWQVVNENALIMGCPEKIVAQASEGVFEIRHLVRSTPQKCVYDEINSAIEGPGTRVVSCDKPKN